MPWPKGRPRSAALTAKIVAAHMANGAKRRKPVSIQGVVHWRCPTCEGWFPAERYYATDKNWNGIGGQCRRCHVEGTIRTRDPVKTADTGREHMRRARRANPAKFRERERLASIDRRGPEVRARTLLNAAVRAGKIVRPKECESCGAEGRIHGHHEDYSQPLSVRWLCTVCHGEVHRKFPRSSSIAGGAGANKKEEADG
jgi:transposase-like protein